MSCQEDGIPVAYKFTYRWEEEGKRRQVTITSYGDDRDHAEYQAYGEFLSRFTDQDLESGRVQLFASALPDDDEEEG